MAFIGKMAGQKIVTDKTNCIQCNRCNNACAMSIDIECKAKHGMAVTDLCCVGCGHCIDACPMKTLSYSTRFLNMISAKGKRNKTITNDIKSNEMNQ